MGNDLKSVITPESIYVLYTIQNDSMDVTCELLTKARKLADQRNWKVVTICFGKEEQEAFQQLEEYGTDKIIHFEKEEPFSSSIIFQYMSELVKNMDSGLILFSDNIVHKIVSARLSVKFDIGLTADCIDVRNNEENDFVFSRTAIGDSVVADIICIESKIFMCTMKSGAIVKEKSQNNHFEGVFTYKAELEDTLDQGIKVLECVSNEEPESQDIQKYNIVFCLGRGVKKSETRDTIEKLAKKYNAGICGTKAAVDEGWIKKEKQVGQSGKCISPKIYIGLGVSGASQHIVGILNSKKIIAINSDENAPIFQYADYTICGNVDEIIAHMGETLFDEICE